MKYRKLKMVKDDPWLEPVAQDIFDRYARYKSRLETIEKKAGSITKFADAYNYFGIHFLPEQNGWIYREWAPNAKDLFLFGDFNNWQKYQHRGVKLPNGVWEIFISKERYEESFVHNSLIKILIHGENGWFERIPVYMTRVVQDDNTKKFSGQLWFPKKKFSWSGDKFKLEKENGLYIYESHVGMAQEKETVGTYQEFETNILPRIKEDGYTAIQLMAIAEHPYYGSFGYHVSNYFAPSSRSGTPEELKSLIKAAHKMGIAVIMDIVHSHTVKNFDEGINEFDGTEDGTYLHKGERGNHPAWDSKIFDYGKIETLEFLLSNIKYWIREFHFDGFRFDGVTSMLYHHHGLVGDWSQERYFKSDVEWDAVTYLQLANTLIHKLNKKGVSIAEDVSGMPGISKPISQGGLGFDYRLGMGLPDFWINLLAQGDDENWNIWHMYEAITNRKWDENTIAYSESHDQALVGDQTIAFQLLGDAMYNKMGIHQNDVKVDRGVAIHKMIRLFTISLGGESYLNFMGNEFGHPEWIDFPREGNNWSYYYARRQWSLADNPELKYKFMLNFDRAMIKLSKKYNLLSAPYPNQLWMDDWNKTIVFERAGLIFVFNWHVNLSAENYSFNIPEAGEYRLILNSDNPEFGGFNRIDENQTYHTELIDGNNRLSIYNINRAALVFCKC